ncbi:MalM family protein [Parasalinivibrio latis]|uniref:MalM family protein n=1 Tax=Parasalinivibrio latis TaxID=2952610 RepID=UPI0030DEAF71
MKKRYSTLALILAASLMGCANTPVETVKNVSIEQAVCCTDYSQFGWIPLNGEELDVTIDSRSPVASFDGGKSYFVAFSMPESIDRLQVDLTSWMSSEGVFAPKILLLDSRFKPVKTIDLDAFAVRPSDMFHLSGYHNRFVIDRNETPYMVVYSPEKYRQGSITIPHPERVRAEELGMARPMVTDPVIQHAKFGSLELDLKPLTLRAYRIEEKPANASPVEHSKAKVETAGVMKTPVSMMSESEAFYNGKIEQAVKAGDISLALKWLDEAKRAGSKTAESTFINLVKP